MTSHALSRTSVATDDRAPAAPQPADETSRVGPAAPSRTVERGSLIALLAATAVLYIAGLGASGWANSFYSAAAQAGSTDWTAFFYGSLDGANSITVDKPPAAMWIMSLSVKLFGLSSWSILVPEALMGVAAVAIIYFTILRSLGHALPAGERPSGPRASHWAALAGAAAFALTPVATLMFRFNNPDALLVLLLTGASYCVVRATEVASRKWLVLAGVLVGFGFLAKMLQAFLVLPAFVIAYVVAAPAAWGRKLVDLLSAFGAMLLSLGWYVAIVELVPESARPYIGGSQTNSLLELIFGYNGLGRITGNQVGSVGGGQGGGWGQTGITRLFDGVSGGMVAWLIPAALILVIASLIALGKQGMRNVRPGGATTGASLASGGLIVYAGWLVVTLLVFSFMAGIYHDYYTVALAPAIGGAVGIGGGVLWAARRTRVARGGLALAALVTGAWAVALTLRAGGAWTLMGIGIAVVALIAAILLCFGRRLAVAGIIALAVSGLAGPAAYSVNTAMTPHTGSIVTAGPAVASNGSPGGRGFGTGQQGTPPGGMRQGQGGGQPGTAPGGTQQGTGGGRQGRTGGGGMGGLLNGATVSAELESALQQDASGYTWAAATVGSQNAASYQLATQLPVMAIGGFNGSDPSPTLDEFKQLVADGRIHYFIPGGVGGGTQNGGSNDASEIASWVEANYAASTIGDTTVYDLGGN